MAERIDVEVVAALPNRQRLIAVKVPADASVGDVIEVSCIATALPEFDVSSCAVAIWGRVVQRSEGVKNGDRVELLRPLMIDPREARRQLAETGEVMGSAGSLRTNADGDT